MSGLVDTRPDTIDTYTHLPDRLLAAAKAYGNACRAFFVAAEACDQCDDDDPRDACDEHRRLASDIGDTRTKLLNLAHEARDP